MLEIAEMIETVLSNVENEEVIAQVRFYKPAFCEENRLFFFYLLTESDKLSAQKRCFLTTKREIEIRTILFRKQRLQSYSVSDKVNIPVHWTLYKSSPSSHFR